MFTTRRHRFRIPLRHQHPRRGAALMAGGVFATTAAVAGAAVAVRRRSTA